MTKHSDWFFKIPIRVYDASSVMNAMREEESTGISHDGDWVKGYIKMSYQSLKDPSLYFYYDVFSKGRTPQEVASKGFDATCLSHSLHGDFEVTWPMEKFEANLNAFLEKIDNDETLEDDGGSN